MKEEKENKAEKAKKKVADLKKEHYDKIPSDANFTEEQESIIKGLLFDAIDEAYAIGCREKLFENVDINESVSKLEDIYKQMSEPTAATRADKYKQLYHNQRIITAHAQAEIQVLQAQIQTLESDGNLFTNVIERMPSIFGAPLTENAFAGR